MALMFPRLARNFAKNGYYPTDEKTLERTLQALAPPSSGSMRIFDPCAGEGVALAEAAHALGRDRVQACAVEYDKERAGHARSLLDQVLHSDLMDTMISRQAFGLLWLNPPYGDLVADHSGASNYQGSGRRRLEKLFYQRCISLLQYGGVLVFLVPHYVLDEELCGWLCNHFTSLRIFSAAERQFKQVVIFGIRVRRQDLARPSQITSIREQLQDIGNGAVVAPDLPEQWQEEPYRVLASTNDLQHFYRVTLEPEQFALEINRLQGLWSDFTLHFGQAGMQPRPPVMALSQWHLALALAAGAISGVVTSGSGRVLALKGDTYKEKAHKAEFTEDEQGNICEVRILTDRFIPVIRAWDLTPGSATLGRVLTITSAQSETAPNDQSQTPSGD
ncbi:class I SAM-dependent methyltransferase [Pseudomonas cichorii]|nr:class I SAM-dependent methyltransferase [Pseudomonas cichorii]